MAQTLKIKLSSDAHTELIEMIKFSQTYDSVRFVYANGCCKTPKVDIYLDNFKTEDIKDTIGDLTILYDESLLDKIKELIIDYKDSRFWIKTILSEDSNTHCSGSDKESCGGCSGHCSHY